MKKVSLFFAMIFAVSMAMGQDNDATITQVGDNNNSEIGQVINDAFDFGHVATSVQEGDDNSSFIKQEETLGNAYVSQVGDANVSDLKQAGYNDADARFTGNSNVLGSYNNLGSGTAFQKNGTGSSSNGFNKLRVNVVGSNNLIGLDQEGGNEALVGVEGSYNEVGLYQRDNNSENSSYARVDIEGWRNTVDVSQGSLEETDNFTKIDIFGHDNVSTVLQESSFNEARVNVIGDANTSTITQN